MTEGWEGMAGVEFGRIPLDQIAPDPRQPRTAVDDAGIAGLVETVLKVGVLTPVLVRPVAAGYVLVLGSRRLRACEVAGKTEIPALICDLDGDACLEIQLIENAQRKNLGPIEWGRSLRTLYEALNREGRRISLKTLGTLVGLTRQRIYQLYALAQLPEAIQQMILDGQISAAHGTELTRLQGRPELQMRLAREAHRGQGQPGRTRKELRRRISLLLGEPLLVGAEQVDNALSVLEQAVGEGLSDRASEELYERTARLLDRLERARLWSRCQAA